jgi:hypothetical protein
MMVEGEMHECGESLIIDGMLFALEAAQPLIALQERLRASNGKPKREFTKPVADEALFAKVKELGLEGLAKAMATKEKKKRSGAVSEIHKTVADQLTAEGSPWAGKRKDVDGAWSKLVKKHARGQTLATKKRIDGRATDEIRPIHIEVGVLPKAHGSALFQRGETQSLGVATLGTKYDEQKLDTLLGDMKKQFYLHYNFPPFSTGEVKPIRGQSRREVGHGFLAERSVARILPQYEDFPYTDPRRVGDPRVQRQLVDGLGVRRLARADGRRRADHLAGGRHRDGPHEGGRRVRHPVGHPRRRGSPRRHGLQGHRHQGRHLRAADGHQGRRPDPQDPRGGARPRRARLPAHPRGR